MVRIRVDIPSESRAVELDVSDQSAAREIVTRVLDGGCADPLIGQVEEGEEGWTLRVKRRSEQGRWWSDQEIREYKDCESFHDCQVASVTDTICQLSLITRVVYPSTRLNTSSSRPDPFFRDLTSYFLLHRPPGHYAPA